MQKIKQFLEVKAMDTILVFMAVFLIVFTITMIVLFCVFQAVPDTLITSVFTCFGAEGGFMSLIQITKRRKEDERNDL